MYSAIITVNFTKFVNKIILYFAKIYAIAQNVT